MRRQTYASDMGNSPGCSVDCRRGHRRRTRCQDAKQLLDHYLATEFCPSHLGPHLAREGRNPWPAGSGDPIEFYRVGFAGISAAGLYQLNVIDPRDYRIETRRHSPRLAKRAAGMACSSRFISRGEAVWDSFSQ